MLDCTSRPLTLADCGCNLGVTEAFDEAQEHDLSLVLAQPSQGVAEVFDLQLRHIVGQRILRRRLGRQVGVGDVAQRDVGAPEPVVVDDQIVGEPKQPGGKRQPTLLVARDRLPRFEEDLLGEILGLVVAAHPVADVPVDPLDVPLVELAERVRVAGLCPRHQEALVGHPVAGLPLTQDPHPPL